MQTHFSNSIHVNVHVHVDVYVYEKCVFLSCQDPTDGELCLRSATSVETLLEQRYRSIYLEKGATNKPNHPVADSIRSVLQESWSWTTLSGKADDWRSREHVWLCAVLRVSSRSSPVLPLALWMECDGNQCCPSFGGSHEWSFKIPTMCGCAEESHESTRQRVEGFPSMTQYNLVHKFLAVLQAMNEDYGCKGSSVQGVGKMEKIPAWQLEKSRVRRRFFS